MSQTESIKEQLHALYDELKSAADNQHEKAKSAVDIALAHMDSAKAQLQAQLKDDHAARKRQAEATLAMLEEVSRNAKKALDDNATALHAHLKDAIASAKSAMDANK